MRILNPGKNLSTAIRNIAIDEMGQSKVREDADARVRSENAASSILVTLPVTSAPDSIGGSFGYDYTSDGTLMRYFGNLVSRFDNFDTLGKTLKAQIIDFVELVYNITYITVQYVPSTTMSFISVPDNIRHLRIYKNGLRLFEGVGFDYVFSGNIITVTGISGDRFVIEYVPEPVGGS